VRSWRLLKSGLPYRIALGPYEEQFREYLLGEAPFPPSAALWVWVARHETPSRAATPPDSHRVGQCHIHFFDVPGVRFFLIIGRTIPEYARLVCVLNGPDQPILVSDAPDQLIVESVRAASKTTRLSRNLQKMGSWRWFDE
jgi:hypothetical protein